MDAIEQNCALSQQYGVFKALRQVALNLLTGDEKYRTLFADNPSVQKSILGHVGGYEFLRAVGFEKGSDENRDGRDWNVGTFWYYRGSKSDGNNLRTNGNR